MKGRLVHTTTNATPLDIGIDAIQRVESMLDRMLRNSTADTQVAKMARAMRHLALARMQLELPGEGDKRLHARIHENAVTILSIDGHPLIEAALHDVSPAGALVECDVDLPAGTACRMTLPGVDEWVEARIRDSQGGLARLSFEAASIRSLPSLLKHLDRHFERY